MKKQRTLAKVFGNIFLFPHRLFLDDTVLAIGSFLFPHHQIFERKLPQKFQTSLIKSKTFFHNSKLIIIMIVFAFFVTQNRKALIFKSKMSEFIGKNSVNKIYISIPNCHTGNILN